MAKEYSAVYTEKKGLFGNKKLNIDITIDENKITGHALRMANNSDYSYQGVEINYGDITNYEAYLFENSFSLKIDVCVHSISRNNYYDTYIFPFNSESIVREKIINALELQLDKFNEAQAAVKAELEEQRNELIRQRKEEDRLEEQRKQEIKDFYANTYAFHIKEGTPVYTLNKRYMECFVVYIGDDKSLNFLLIDAEHKTEIHSIIKYDEVHYYEKAGAVHYATNINANYTGSQSFGGSFVGARASVGASVLGGLLFGTMGMAIGAMASYKPSEYTPPTYTPSQLNISSEITKIDERSVILNYYSEQKQQYVDIELPQEIFNFLQTFLPDKKYAIVLAKETQDAVQAPTTESAGDDTVARLKKLKELYEMELISESEYTERKKEILAGI